jgi:EmrB/QacA subfamily drug resistance transporter
MIAAPPSSVVAVLPDASHRLTERAKRIIVAGVMLAMFLAALDSTIVAPALPTIGASLGGASFLPWVVSAYFLTSTAVTPLYGKLSDIRGRRPVLLAALALFLIGSVACALSPDMAALIVARALQGLGGGGLVALAQTVLADVATPRERAQYAVYISVVWAVASIAGPVLGGALAQHWSWTVIFWLNLPLGALAAYVCDRNLRDLPQALRPHKLDLIGSALVMGASVCLMLMLTLGGAQAPWTSPAVLSLGLAAVVLGGALLWHLRRAPEPLIPLSIFANRVVDKATAAMFFGIFAYLGATVYLPIYFETCLGLDPTVSGAGLIALLGATVIGSYLTGSNVPKLKHYKIMGYVGLPLASLAMGALALAAPWLNFAGAEALLIVYGLGVGALFPIVMVSVQNAVDPRDMGVATATVAFLRSLGSAIGVAVIGAVVFAFGLGAPGAKADPVEAAQAFRAAFALMTLASLISLACFVAMEELVLRGPAKAAA